MKKNVTLSLCNVYKFYCTVQNFWEKIVLVNNDFLFISLIKDAFSSDWLFICSLLQRGENYKESRGEFFNSKTIQL